MWTRRLELGMQTLDLFSVGDFGGKRRAANRQARTRRWRATRRNIASADPSHRIEAASGLVERCLYPSGLGLDSNMAKVQMRDGFVPVVNL